MSAGAEGAPRPAFPTWRIVVFALGGIGTTVIGSLAGLLAYFYVPPATSQAAFPPYISTQTFLGLTFVGLIGYLAGIAGAAFNAIIASWSDRSRSRLGRRRLFMMVGLLPVALLTFLLFLPPVDGVSAANAAWLLAIMLLLYFFRGFSNVAGALVPELGASSRIMMLFSTWNSVGWILGFVIGGQLVFVVKDALMGAGLSPVEAFRLTLGGMIAAAVLVSALQFLVVDERRYCAGSSSGVPVLPALRKALGNRTFVHFVATNQLYQWGDGLMQMGLVYVMTMLFGQPEERMLAFSAVTLVLSLLLYPLVNLAAARMGKKLLFAAGILGQALVMALFALAGPLGLPPGPTTWILVAFLAIPAALTGIVPGAIQNEIIREDCARTGEANEASFVAAVGVITVIPSGLPGLVFPSLLLNGQSASNAGGVRLVAYVGCACMLAAFCLLLSYRERSLRASLAAHGYR